MTTLPREMQPDPALEERVVSALAGAGLVRRRRVWPAWAAAAAAVAVVVFGVTMFPGGHRPVKGNTYVVLLYEDSTYRPAAGEQQAERVAEMARWGDSLDTQGEFERAGRLIGPGEIGGLFIIRAADDAEAARIVATCPFHKWGGHIEVERFEP
ncbi:MAG TPA: YciI family protein [Gemmatimonadaceae bacterium]